jgi:putative phosphoribosyl transferase
MYDKITEKLFVNRKDAGQKLAKQLEHYRDTDALVLGIPRGGVEVAYYVARHLKAELSVIISKKIPLPGQPEYGVGSICEEGTVFLDRRSPLSESELKPEIEQLNQEIRRRVLLYREGRKLPQMKGRSVILIDDGIATGVTLVAAILFCKRHNAKKVIVASPVSGKTYAEELNHADEIVVLNKPELFYGVGQVYEEFSQLGDAEVISYLKQNGYTNQNGE